MLLRNNAQHLGMVCSNNIVLGMMLETPRALKEHNSHDTCPNEVNKVLIGIHAMNKCQWNSGSTKSKFGQ